MKAYILYLIKNKWLQTAVLSIIPSVISMTIIGLSRSFINISPTYYLPNPDIMLTPVVMMIIMLFVVPVLKLSPLKNAKEVDLYYALPMKQSKLYLSHLIFGLFQTIIIWTSIFFLSLFVFMAVYARLYHIIWLIPIYFVGIFYISMIYALMSFIFMRANQLLDGIAFILLWHVALVLVPAMSVIFGYSFFGEYLPFLINPFSGFSSWSTSFMVLSNPLPRGNIEGYIFFYNPTRLVSVIIHTTLFLALTIASLYYTIKHMDDEPVENIGAISKSYFGFRVLIPLVLFLSVLFVNNLGGTNALPFIFIVILTSFALIGYFIYRRTVKIAMTDIFQIFIALASAITLSAFM